MSSPSCSASDQLRIHSIMSGFFCSFSVKSPSLVKKSTDGVKKLSALIPATSLGTILIGLTPIVKITVKITNAVIKFITTPATIIMSFFQSFAAIKVSLSSQSSSLLSSPLSETNPPRGIQLRVYSVPDLSFHKVQIFGGIQIPNSFTFTPDFFAAQKCPSSWIITKNINIPIPSIIPSIFYIFIILKVFSLKKDKKTDSEYSQIDRKSKTSHSRFASKFIFLVLGKKSISLEY